MNSNKKTNQDKKLKYYFDDISNKVKKVNQYATTKLQKKKNYNFFLITVLISLGK